MSALVESLRKAAGDVEATKGLAPAFRDRLAALLRVAALEVEEKENSITTMRLCESRRVLLKQFELYRFTIDQDCEECVRLAEEAA